jgi:23S rRNA pseudouridine1911/1915/1917 synthase
VLKNNKGLTLLKVNLETGRKNQIRVHMQELGHPVVGDKKYGSTISPIKRLGLHAQQLSFIHPVTREQLNFETKIPRVFQTLF